MKSHTTLIRLIALLLMAAILKGCYLNQSSEPTLRKDTVVEGYSPVYTTSDGGNIKFVAAREVKNPGKIYIYGQYLLVNEINQGIHVFDNLDPKNPTALGFIQLVGNSDMAIKNNILYADHMGNIVALKIQDFNNLTEQASLPLQNWNYGTPPPSGFPFECINTEKGIVVDWKKTEIKNPSCYAN